MATGRLVHHGGLFRCCVQTVWELPDDAPETDGLVIPCKWCTSGRIRFVGVKGTGHWEWADKPTKNHNKDDKE